MALEDIEFYSDDWFPLLEQDPVTQIERDARMQMEKMKFRGLPAEFSVSEKLNPQIIKALRLIDSDDWAIFDATAGCKIFVQKRLPVARRTCVLQ